MNSEMPDNPNQELEEVDKQIINLLNKRFNIINSRASHYVQEKNKMGMNAENQNCLSPRQQIQLKRICDLMSVHSNKLSVNSSPGDIIHAIAKRPLVIAGPCAVESEKQINAISKELREQGVKFLRGGAFKPRTSPHSFQGRGLTGLMWMKRAAAKNKQYVVSEVMDSYQLDLCYDLIDVIQIGSRNMSSYSFLKYVGKVTAEDKKPIILKRGFGATVNELINAAEYIIREGNPNVILCLRGIRTFEQADSVFRNTPDLMDLIEIKEKSKLPVIFDPSHSSGDRKYVEAFSKTALNVGFDGLIIECHNSPDDALVDGKQSITFSQLKRIMSNIK